MSSVPISAIVLAAGLSSRMGRSKPLLPFGRGTVVEHIVAVLSEARLAEILVVTGHARDQVERQLTSRPVRCIYNPDYAAGEMLSSIQTGLRACAPETSAALIVLCDQPNLAPGVVTHLVGAYLSSGAPVVRPVFGGRSGHPILIGHALWAEVLALPWTSSLRDVLRTHAGDTLAVAVDADSVLRDMDTPDEYAREVARYRSDA